MNKLVTRLQTLRQKADQIRQVVEAAPAKAAQLRDAVHATTGQLQQLREDVQGTVQALKSDTEASQAETLVELDAGVGVLARAGYDLTGVDLEQGVHPRVIAHLSQLSEARTEPLEDLLRECAGKRVLTAILESLIQAEKLEENVRLADLSFSGLIVHVGAVPTVRLCWRRAAEELPQAVKTAVAAAAPTIVAPTVTASPPPLPGFALGSMFEKRSAVPSAEVAVPSQPAEVVATAPSISVRTGAPAKPAEPAVASTGDWRKDALARFKKMPNLGR